METNYKYLNEGFEESPANKDINSFSKIYRIGKSRNIKLWTISILVFTIAVLLLPWTQNINANGNITAIKQEQRPQEINTILPGKIVKWFVKEGDYVNAGDTILQLGEIKVDYFDPQLLERTQNQINAKKSSANAYENKAAAAQAQTNVLSTGRALKQASIDNKIEQQKLKVRNDETDLVAVNNELSVYKRQIEAGKIMLDSGAVSLIDFEKRKVNYQNAVAKKTIAENKLSQSRQELINLSIEQNISVMDYNDKISKADGDRFGSLSSAAATEADISKLENTYSSYDIRNKLYYVTASQSGQITKAKKAGIGEMLKEGEMIAEIVPDKIDYAVEMYVEPMDLPLVNKGQKVRFVFDGIPAIVFSGWPQGSFGTFGGIISAYETNVSANGKFRILVIEDTSEKKWPKNLRMGSGAKGIALLKDVPIYYELWRHINGFPPDFYKPVATNNKEEKK
jgi:multidrug efflux pump subunit AcrA (membrane-fusion protein)